MRAVSGKACLVSVFVLLGLAIIFVFTMCSNSPMIVFGPGAGDFSAKLCGDYLLFRTSAYHIIISPQNCDSTTPIIPTQVVEVGHDERFIIAKRNELERRSPNDPNDTYMQPTCDVFDYWILDTHIPKVYGSLTQEEFVQKRQELGVPDNVVMKDVYEYRKNE